MAELLTVPEVAAGATEVVIAEWLVASGDEFKSGDPIAVVETEKAVIELEAESDATLLRPLVQAGSTVQVGAPMALLGSAAEATADLDTLLTHLGVAEAGDTPDRAPATDDVAQPHTQSSEPGHTAPTQPSAEAETRPETRQFVSPIARKLLREAGLTTDGIAGTGPNGRIRRRDVESAIAAAGQRPAAVPEAPQPTTVAPTPAAEAPAPSPWTEIPHSRLRRAIANRLTQSKRDIPHFYLKRTARLDALQALRTELNQASPVKISVNDSFIRAIAVAHTQVPDANVIWTDEAMRRFDTVDISVAIASERGLVTPVLRGVEKSSLSAISTQVTEFAELANAGRLQQQDLEGGSITISNLGMHGVEEFSAIINPPQSAILAVGAARPTVQPVDGKPTVVTAAELVLSVDHRAIDGALAAQWMAALVHALENPLRLVV